MLSFEESKKLLHQMMSRTNGATLQMILVPQCFAWVKGLLSRKVTSSDDVEESEEVKMESSRRGGYVCRRRRTGFCASIVKYVALFKKIKCPSQTVSFYAICQWSHIFAISRS